MSERIDFRPLESLVDEWNEVKANDLFRDYLKKLEKYLDIAPIDKHVSISMASREEREKITDQDIYGVWVERNQSEKGLELTISYECGKLLPYVLLRELYNCFIAKQLKSFESVQHAINAVLIEDASFGKYRLRKERTNKWRRFIDENRQQKEQELERIGGYLIDDTLHQRVLQHLFRHLQEYGGLIKKESENFSDILFQVYRSNSIKLLFEKNGQVDSVETLRCLNLIFNSVKRYRALLEYEKYFQEFKKGGTLKTDLTLNQFKNSMKQIKHTVISPAYKTNWSLLGVSIVYMKIKFNPSLKPSLVDKIVRNLGFSYVVKRIYFSHSSEMFIGFFLPEKYLKDLNSYFNQLKELKYVLSFSKGKNQFNTIFRNLNHFRDYSNQSELINPKASWFDPKYMFITERDLQMKAKRKTSWSILDFLVMDRIRSFSITGLGFERRAEQLQVLNHDLKKEIANQLGLLKRFEENLLKIVKSIGIKKKFADFIKLHKSDGFFAVKEVLANVLAGLKFVKDFESLYSGLKSIKQLQGLLELNKLSLRFEENLIFTDKSLNKKMSRKFIPLYFQSKEKFQETLEQYQVFYDVLDSCSELKLFDLGKVLNLVNDYSLTKRILDAKKERVEKYYLKYNNYSFTEKKFDKLLEKLLNEDPPIVFPSLFNTNLGSFSISYIGAFVSKNFETFEEKFKIKVKTELQPYLESIEVMKFYDQNLNNTSFVVLMHTPFMTLSERLLFTSIVYNLFRDELRFFKICRGYPWIPVVSLRDHYNFEENSFFHTKDYFKHQLLFAKKTFGELSNNRTCKEGKFNPKSSGAFYSNDSSLESLVKLMRKRIKRARGTVDKTLLEQVIKLDLNLKQKLLQQEDFNELKNEEYFKIYVKSVKILPLLSRFGLSQYYLYFFPTDLSKVNFKSLLANTFQSVKYNLGFDDSRPFLIKYLFPFRNPNLAYVNRLAKTDKIVREYCAFAIKKVYQVLHADNSLPSDNWSVDFKKFKIYAQKVLFNPDYSDPPLPGKEFDLHKTPTERVLGPETFEYLCLSEIYYRKSFDLLPPRILNRKIIERVQQLLKKDLLFPFVKLKNLGLHEKLYIIVPEVNSEANEKLLTLFSYFNYCFIYEIEGETFISGLDEVIRFDNGLYVKLYLPNCNVGEIEQLFRQIFQILEIDHYVILENMVKNDEFLKSVYGDLEFLKDYNPLLNLKWSPKDQKWLNHKLYDQQFNPVYPDLSYGKDNVRDGINNA